MNNISTTLSDAIAFPRLVQNDLALLKPMTAACSFEDGETIFRAGDAEMDLYVVETGAVLRDEANAHSTQPGTRGNIAEAFAQACLRFWTWRHQASLVEIPAVAIRNGTIQVAHDTSLSGTNISGTPTIAGHA